MSMYAIGKMNPKDELMKNTEEINSKSVSENFGLLLKYNTF